MNRIVIGVETANNHSYYDIEISFLNADNKTTILGTTRIEYQEPYYRRLTTLFVNNPQHQLILENNGLLTLKYIASNSSDQSPLTISYIASVGPHSEFSKIYAAGFPYFQSDNSQIRYDADIDSYVLWTENVSPPTDLGSSQTIYSNILYDPSFENGDHWYNLKSVYS